MPDEKNQSEEDAKIDELIDDIKNAADEKEPEEAPKPKDEKSQAAAENSDEEKKQAAENDKKKSEEAGKDSGEKEEEAKPPDEWKEKFDNQTKQNQKIQKEKAEKNYQTEKKFVENSPDRLLELSNSSDDDDVKLANRLSQEIYNLPLKDALATIKKSRSDAGEEEETREERDARIKNETARDAENIHALGSFKEKHPILDSDSKEFDKEVGAIFEKKFASLSGDGKMLKEDFKEALDDAYFIATKDLKAKAKEKDADDAQKKIAEAGAGGGEKKLDLNEKKDDIDGLCDDITAIANPKK